MRIEENAKLWIKKVTEMAKDILDYPESYDGKLQAASPDPNESQSIPYWFYTMDLPEAASIPKSNPIYRTLNTVGYAAAAIYEGKAYISFFPTGSDNALMKHLTLIHIRNMDKLLCKVKDGIKESLGSGFDLSQKLMQRFVVYHCKDIPIEGDEAYEIEKHFGKTEWNEPKFENFVVPPAIFQVEKHNSSEKVEIGDKVGFLNIEYEYSPESIIAYAYWIPQTQENISDQKKKEAQSILDQATWSLGHNGFPATQIDYQLMEPYLGVLDSILPYYAKWQVVDLPMGEKKEKLVLVYYMGRP